MAIPIELSPLSLTPMFDNKGRLAPLAQLYFYKVGTEEPITVFKDPLGQVAWAQPVVTGGSGRVPPVYVNDVSDYKVRILTNEGELIEEVSSLPKARADAGTTPGGAVAGALEVGDVVWRFNQGNPRTGFVRCNGNTIGSAASGATEANGDLVRALFDYLWGQDTFGYLPIYDNLGAASTRGATAAGDWAANKRLSLPDLRGRMICGVTNMGGANLANLTGAYFEKGTQIRAGSLFGRATETLAETQIPAHDHVLTDNGHIHTATSPLHNHTITDNGHIHTATSPPHDHTITQTAHSHTATSPAHEHAVSQPAHTHTISQTAHTHGANGHAHSHTVDLPSHSHTFTGTSHSHTFTGAAHNHGINDPGHTHAINAITSDLNFSADANIHYGVDTPNHNYNDIDPDLGYGDGVKSRKTGLTLDNATAGGTVNPATATGAISSYDFPAITSGTADPQIDIDPANAIISLGSTAPTIDMGAVAVSVTVNPASANINLDPATATVSVAKSYTEIALAPTSVSVTLATGFTGISMAETGGGQAHNNMPPVMLGTWYMKL